jgi:ketosteroid isomerase-like protein
MPPPGDAKRLEQRVYENKPAAEDLRDWARLAGAKETRRGGALESGPRAAGEPAGGPRATSLAFGRALLARDPRAAAACLSPDALMLSADGTELSGREQAFALLSQITASEQVLEIRIGRCVEAGAVALCTEYWRRSTPGSGGHESASVARLVLPRSGTSWRIAIASPWE